jgi:fatty acid desaturase
MTIKFAATNAASSGVYLDRKTVKALCRRSDRPGLIYVLKWVISLLVSGCLIYLAQDSLWVWPAMFIYGTILSVPAYSMSHETAHGTAFKTRWLNEMLNWITALLYIEEPLHRRYTHTNHHTYTWHVGKDSQMPFDTPMAFGGWLAEATGYASLYFAVITNFRLMFARYTAIMRSVIPADELPHVRRNAWIFFLVYAATGGLIVLGVNELLWFLVIPMLLGRPSMVLITLIQHVEMAENSPSIIDSTRSFKTNWIVSFLYMNMHNHVEHHLYPQVPFYSLPALHEAIKDQLPKPDSGFWRTSCEVLTVVVRRSLKLNTKTPTIRQAPHMITEGEYERVSVRSMK